MSRLFGSRRLLVTAALLVLFAAPAMLMRPHAVGAFTLPPDILYFDPISVPAGHTLHVHVVNELGGASMDFRTFVKPTTPAAGSPVVTAPVSLAPGEGIDQDFAFAAFTPPAGALRVPVVAAVIVSMTGGGAPPADWSGRVATSAEIVDDVTGVQTAILGGRHILRGPTTPTPCLSCN